MLELATAFLGVFLAQASPGPNMMAVASASLGSGRYAGVMTAVGIASGAFVWAVLLATGVGAVLQAFPETLTAMRLIGGGYLLYLGGKAILSSIKGKSGNAQADQELRLSGRTAALRGFLVVLTNAKAAMMWIALAMFLASSGYSNLEFLAVGAGAALSALSIYTVYALLFSTGVAVRAYRRFFRSVDALFGVMFGAVGGRLVIDGIREIRS